MRRIVTAILLYCLFTPGAHGQLSTVDSLQQVLAIYIYQDTARVNVLTTLAQNAWGSNPQLTRQCAEEALTLSGKLNYPKGVADAYRELSRYYWSQTDYHRAIEYALVTIEKYDSLRNYEGVSWCLGTIGICYAQANHYERSVDYQKKALDLNKQIHNKPGIARDLNNLGYVAELQKDFNQALLYYQQALDMRKEIGVEADVVMPLSNVGSAYLALGDYTLARFFFENALTLAVKVGNKNLQALSYQNLAEIKSKTGDYHEARPYLQQALELAAAIGDKKRKECAYEILRDIEKADGNFEAAFQYQLLLQNLRDTLYSQQRIRQLTQLESRLEGERKEQAIHLLEHDKQTQVRWNKVLMMILFILASSFIIFYGIQRYRLNKNHEILSLTIDRLKEQQKKLADQYTEAIIGETARQESQDQRILRQAIEVVDEYISDPTFGVEKMANVMGMSRTNLHRKLKLISGIAPGDFIRSIRLKRAAHLLKHQTDSVSQVGFTVGFEDQSYFSKCFKKQFGMSPSEYSRSIVPIPDSFDTNLPVIDT
jgi:AraC-like DNA-binding protein